MHFYLVPAFLVGDFNICRRERIVGRKLTETNSVVKKRFILKKTEKILMFTELLLHENYVGREKGEEEEEEKEKRNKRTTSRLLFIAVVRREQVCREEEEKPLKTRWNLNHAES